MTGRCLTFRPMITENKKAPQISLSLAFAITLPHQLYKPGAWGGLLDP